MSARQIRPENALPCGLIDCLPFQKIIDIIVGDTVDFFIGAQRRVRLKIRGRHLEYQFLRSAHMLGNGPHPSFGQAGEWQDISGSIAELGEEPHESLGRLISPDHQSSG